jgi:hypothetical protein
MKMSDRARCDVSPVPGVSALWFNCRCRSPPPIFAAKSICFSASPRTVWLIAYGFAPRAVRSIAPMRLSKPPESRTTESSGGQIGLRGGGGSSPPEWKWSTHRSVVRKLRSDVSVAVCVVQNSGSATAISSSSSRVQPSGLCARRPAKSAVTTDNAIVSRSHARSAGRNRRLWMTVFAASPALPWSGVPAWPYKMTRSASVGADARVKVSGPQTSLVIRRTLQRLGTRPEARLARHDRCGSLSALAPHRAACGKMLRRSDGYSRALPSRGRGQH